MQSQLIKDFSRAINDCEMSLLEISWCLKCDQEHLMKILHGEVEVTPKQSHEINAFVIKNEKLKREKKGTIFNPAI